MLDKLAELSQRFDEVNEALADPEVVLDQARYQQLSREHSDLDEVVQTFRAFQKTQKTLTDNQAIASDSGEEAELRELARLEIPELAETLESLQAQLQVLLLPKDEDGPPFGADREEILSRFSPHFELLSDWTPRSYPNRTGLEHMFLWKRKT